MKIPFRWNIFVTLLRFSFFMALFRFHLYSSPCCFVNRPYNYVTHPLPNSISSQLVPFSLLKLDEYLWVIRARSRHFLHGSQVQKILNLSGPGRTYSIDMLSLTMLSIYWIWVGILSLRAWYISILLDPILLETWRAESKLIRILVVNKSVLTR